MSHYIPEYVRYSLKTHTTRVGLAADATVGFNFEAWLTADWSRTQFHIAFYWDQKYEICDKLRVKDIQNNLIILINS